MCGRTACTLNPRQIPLAASYPKNRKCQKSSKKAKSLSSNNQYEIPQNCPKAFYQDRYEYSIPSTNISPTSITPVICNSSLFLSDQKGGVNALKDEEEISSERIIVPMMWGLIPPYFKGEDPKKHGLSTNNARIEGLRESKLYKPCLTHNRRCVIIVDGFYEWKTFKGGKDKQPYFVYASQEKGRDITKISEENDDEDNFDKKSGWTGPKPLFLAGIYSKWTSNDGEKPIYSYSIITRESKESSLEWLHSRCPVILNNEDLISAWLDPSIQGLNSLEIVDSLEPREIKWHPVKRNVGNVRNKDSNLTKPIDLDDKENSKSSSLITNWLKGGTKISVKRENDDESGNEEPLKKIKIEKKK